MTDASRPDGVLAWIERAGNRLPDPAMLFAAGTALVMVLSQVVASLGWSVDKSVAGAAPQAVTAVGLLSPDGLWWLLSHLVQNFVSFPPLGLVLVGMLGIGLAERSGLIPALLTRALTAVPGTLLTPAMVFLGIMSSLSLDAGYVLLPPLAAALYYALNRPPLAGLAAAFAGVSAGFSANLFITAVDPLLVGLTQLGAQVLEPAYQVAVTSNWWFMIASTVVLTAVGWLVTSRWVEPRLGPVTKVTGVEHAVPAGGERRALWAAGAALVGVVAAFVCATLIPGGPLHGAGTRFPRWVEAMIPLVFFVFAAPALAYGLTVGTLRNSRDIARLMGETMSALGPYIVLAFFAAQFIACFNHSQLGVMVALAVGGTLAQVSVPPELLVVLFILIVLLGNLFIGSASAKYAFLAPVFVPMFMLVGISPELTQAAYRVGDSASNVIAPLNPYMIIILSFMQRYRPDAGIGTLVSLMLPYAAAFALAWITLLLAWLTLGLALGPGGPLAYPVVGGG